MNEYIEYIENVSRGVHQEQHTVLVSMQHNWTDRIDVIKEHINMNIPSYAEITASYNEFFDETLVCFKWATTENDII